jgi:hypothetical protein
MTPNREGVPQQTLPTGRAGAWQRHLVGSAGEAGQAVAAVLAALADAGYSEGARGHAGQALGEAVAGALACGRPGAPGHARLDYLVGADQAIVEVESRGAGEGPPLQGPHAPGLLRAPEPGAQPPGTPGPADAGEQPAPRSYAWLRLHRRADFVEVCIYRCLS